ncbi:MAG TPA: hypothetical protein PLO39_00910 [Saprospiraceae bacterium]|jgi:hypothetical protein|nr:hypothetical protein [Saprospiraceae bacterium]
MTEAKSLIYSLNRKIDRLNTENKRHLKIVDLCSALTEAQYYLLKDRIQHIEKDKRNRYELRQLEIKEHREDVVVSNKVSTIRIPDNLYRDLGIRIIASKRGCGKKEIPLTKMETQDTGKSLDNPFWKSSFGWEQVFGDVAGGYLYIYNGTDFKVEGAIIDYIRGPGEIHCPSLVRSPEEYVDWNGVRQVADTAWELDDLVKEGINLAAMMLTRDLGDYKEFQLQLSNNIQTEQINKL